jgi:hypothetical protein
MNQENQKHMNTIVNKPIMTPDHPGWASFCDKLSTHCTVEERRVNGVTVGVSSVGCQGDHRFARAILPEFNVDVEGSITFFKEHGGYCDCEILFNVECSCEQEEEKCS